MQSRKFYNRTAKVHPNTFDSNIYLSRERPVSRQR